MKIRTTCVCPPIPIRNCDWTAIDEDTYDCDFIGGETNEWKCGPMGVGATEQEAIDDLMEQLDYPKPEDT